MGGAESRRLFKPCRFAKELNWLPTPPSRAQEPCAGRGGRRYPVHLRPLEKLFHPPRPPAGPESRATEGERPSGRGGYLRKNGGAMREPRARARAHARPKPRVKGGRPPRAGDSLNLAVRDGDGSRPPLASSPPARTQEPCARARWGGGDAGTQNTFSIVSDNGGRKWGSRRCGRESGRLRTDHYLNLATRRFPPLRAGGGELL